MGSLVLVAAGMTCALVGTLTLYACFTDNDITMWGGILFACLIAFIGMLIL